MDPKLSAPPGSTSASSLKDRLDRLQRELATLRTRAHRSSRLTTAIGLIVLIALGVYFYIGYSKISPILSQPDLLVDYAQMELEKKIPDARRALEEQIIRNAPGMAESLSKQALNSLPSARQQLEEYAMEQYQEGFQEVTSLSEKEFRAYLQKNRTMLEKQFKELADNPTLAQASLADLEASLEQQLQADMRAEAKQLLENLRSVNTHMARLAANKGLNREEQEERTVVMIARRLHLEATDPASISKYASAAQPVIKPRPKKVSGIATTGKAQPEKKTPATTSPPGATKDTPKKTKPATLEKDAKKP